jgi:hypothetical protein
MPEESAVRQAASILNALPEARGANLKTLTLDESLGARQDDYATRASITATYTMAILLAANPAGMDIPSQAAATTAFHVTPSFSTMTSGEAVNDARVAFAAAKAGFAPVNPAHDVWQTVEDFSLLALHVTAADTLLDYIVACLDNENFTNLDSLIRLMAENTASGTVTHDEQALARVINALGLTLRHRERLKNRAALRSAYRDRIAEAEGDVSAKLAVEYL